MSPVDAGGVGPRRRLAWLPPVLLVLLLVGVAGVELRRVAECPLPPTSQHYAYRMVPQVVHRLLGDAWLGDPAVGVGFDGVATGPRAPLPWSSPAGLLEELRDGGRLEPFLGHCSRNFWSCAPTTWVLLGLLALAVPGHPVAVAGGLVAWFLVLLVALYGIGRTVRGPWTGLAAACIAAGYPAFFGFALWIEGYLPATALSACMVLALLRSRGLTRLGPTVAFAACTFLAWRIGEGFSETLGVGLAVSGPFVVEVALGLREGWRQRRVPWPTLRGLVVLAALLLPTLDLHWPLVAMEHVGIGFRDAFMGATATDPGASPFLVALIRYGAYFFMIFQQYLKPAMVGWLLLGLAALAFADVRRKLTLFLWFAIPMIAYSYMLRKSLWYALPVVPPLAVLTAAGLAGFRPRPLRGAVFALAAATALFQLTTFGETLRPAGPGAPGPGRELHLFLRQERRSVLNMRQVDLLSPWGPGPRMLYQGTKEIVSLLDARLPRSDTFQGWVGALGDAGEVSRFRYLLTMHRPDLDTVDLQSDVRHGNRALPDLLPADGYVLVVRFERENLVSPLGPDGRPVIDGRGPPAPALVRYVEEIVRGGIAVDHPPCVVVGR